MRRRPKISAIQSWNDGRYPHALAGWTRCSFNFRSMVRAGSVATLRRIVERSMRGQFDRIDARHKRESDANTHGAGRECHTACEAVSSSFLAMVTPQRAISPNAQHQPRLFLILVESRRASRPKLYDWLLSERAGSSDDASPAVWRLALIPEKNFSRTVLPGEQAFDDQALGGKMIPGLAE